MNNQTKGLRKFLSLGQAEIAKSIRGNISPDLLIRATLTYAQKNPKVFECTHESIAKCLMDCGSLGLLPDGTLGTAYLVPYKTTCTLIIGYRGLIELARRSGQLTSIEAHVVREGDTFECEFGLDPVLKHVPALNGNHHKDVTAAYAIAHFKDGSHHCEVMSKAEVDAIRARSRASSNGPWVTDYNEMAKKTVVRRLMKYMPLSPEMSQVFEAADREYIQDAEVSESGAPQGTKSDQLTKQLGHTPHTNIEDEVERNAQERQAAEDAAVQAGQASSEHTEDAQARGPEEGKPADHGGGGASAGSPNSEAKLQKLANGNSKIFIRQLGDKRFKARARDMSPTDLDDAMEAAKSARADPDIKPGEDKYYESVIDVLEAEQAKRAGGSPSTGSGQGKRKLD